MINPIFEFSWLGGIAKVHYRTVLLHSLNTYCHKLCKERGIDLKVINLLLYKQSCLVLSFDLGVYRIFCSGINVLHLIQEDGLML